MTFWGWTWTFFANGFKNKDAGVDHRRSDKERWDPAEDTSKRISDQNNPVDGGKSHEKLAD